MNMYKQIAPLLAAIIFTGSMVAQNLKSSKRVVQQEEQTETIVKESTDDSADKVSNVPTFLSDPIIVTDEWIYPLSEEEVNLIAQLVMAEAEGQPEEGKRMVIDVVLNRVDNSHYPDNVTDVIYEPAQFSPMWNGRFERCHVKHDIKELVMDELLNRTNYEVMYFNAWGYSKYGSPLFQIGDHYFSKRD